MGVVMGVVVVGGWSEDNKSMRDVYTYTNTHSSWLPLAPLPIARYSHSVVACDGFVYVIGGKILIHGSSNGCSGSRRVE